MPRGQRLCILLTPLHLNYPQHDKCLALDEGIVFISCPSVRVDCTAVTCVSEKAWQVSRAVEAMKDKSEYTAFVSAFEIIPNAPEFLSAIQSEWHTVYLFGNRNVFFKTG